ncbi:DUF2254 domain-containing protein [Luteolibacter algae]|uniref:DUF2254 domain-containing protein n=2 Tax=Luteolibacter algae TaxID=454151 RepID=A0ABW5D702_9BACT
MRSRLWVKPAIMSLAAVLWVSFAYFGAFLLPEDMRVVVKREILINLLGIMASTMLTVATFSVAAMVSAYSAVSTTATPRATRIVMQDRSSQNSLTSFLAAFIYAIIALVAISIVEYGAGGRVLLFAGYSGVLIWVLISFVRWVDRVSKLGRMGDTLERVEESCRETFSSPETMGTLGAKTADDSPVTGARITADIIGYVQNIDVAELNEIAGELGTSIRVMERPGAFVDPHDALVTVLNHPNLEEEMITRIRNTFQLGDSRRVSSDPRFGMILLSEIADRALSPAVNDPGTAIVVLGIQVRLMEMWSQHHNKEEKIKYEHIEVPPLSAEDLLDDAFTAISRDGAGIFEVGARIQKSLAVLGRLSGGIFASAARRHSRLALEQAELSLVTDDHKKIVRQLAEQVGNPAN